jgi:flagellar basal body-associated protein FliL
MLKLKRFPLLLRRCRAGVLPNNRLTNPTPHRHGYQHTSSEDPHLAPAFAQAHRPVDRPVGPGRRRGRGRDLVPQQPAQCRSRAAAALPAAPLFVALEPMTVNLQPGGRSRFLHAAVTLKVPDAKSQALVTQYLPEVRSRLLTVLSNRASDALITPEEKAKLAAEIMAALNQPLVPNLPSLKISSVMFTTFMLQ